MRNTAAMILLVALIVFSGCTPSEDCDNGIDDDNNGVMDCFDPACVNANHCSAYCYNSVTESTLHELCAPGARCEYHTRCNPELCLNGVDDNGNGLVDCADPQCAITYGCYEICDNGVDDNKDNKIDCDDPQCATESFCTNACSFDTLYFDSPASCVPPKQCGASIYAESLTSQCLNEDLVGTGDLFDTCNLTTEDYCPFGAMCLFNYGCAPFCDNDTSSPAHNCPAGSQCLFSVNKSGGGLMYLCAKTGCDPVEQNCQSPQHCVFLGTDDSTVCVPGGGTVPLGGSCTYDEECIKGAGCVAQQCYKYCELGSSGCSSGQSCYQVTDDINTTEIWGVCASL
ncbi:hypothetical protein KKF84_15300 [Myxococcota bacterium]|nr:hypothetical protein [Myxococcota bacterium]MBU1536689.1 hypothetical protein [Myxococcota bacterium]